MKGTIRITIPREAVKEIVERHVAESMTGQHEMKEWTVHRNGSIEVALVEKQPELPLAGQE